MLATDVTTPLYANIKSQISDFCDRFGRAPSLATVLVGEDPASHVYVAKKGSTAKELGLDHKDFHLPEQTSFAELSRLINQLNEDDAIDGILIQKPLPSHIEKSPIQIFDLISPAKDVDCFHPNNVGLLSQGRAVLKPCTPAGVMAMLDFYGVNLSGKTALVLGRSDIVGKPMGQLLLQKDATVIYAHSKTKDLASFISQADIVVAAIGKPYFLTNAFQWKKDAIVIDVGINRLEVVDPNTGAKKSRVVGDIHFDQVFPLVKAITPVPGGVGPMTIAMLMDNTLKAALTRQHALTTKERKPYGSSHTSI